jgi:hypothetical protein
MINRHQYPFDTIRPMFTEPEHVQMEIGQERSRDSAKPGVSTVP